MNNRFQDLLCFSELNGERASARRSKTLTFNLSVPADSDTVAKEEAALYPTAQKALVPVPLA